MECKVQRKIRTNKLLILLIMILSLVFSCGCSDSNKNTKESKKVKTSSSQSEQTLMVYSGAGLRKAMDEVGKKFKEKYGIQVQFNYANCSQVMSQLQLSNNGDVFVAGSKHYYDLANEKGLVEKRIDVAYHIPAIAVSKGNPKNIKSIKDLKKDGVKVILGDLKSTAIGRVSKKMLGKEKIFNDVMKNVEATTATVNELIVHLSMNEADAAIVWADTIYNLKNVQAVSIPKDKNIIKTVPITILKNSKKKELAKKFQDFVVSEEGKKCFENHGFKTIE
ncbi:molybdate ABC transporter substrate-binding protein [Haloimpatiens sp. FM7330]|uniref:molybdate ABC transporter substrate-binding protein n=1 Tax=Haloimpatiens sp. FM7330 TaxID=3298610 RepID=UPI003638FD35